VSDTASASTASAKTAADTAWLDIPLAKLIGGSSAKQLAQLDLRTAEDLLRHFPRRHVEHGEATDLARLPVGEHVTVLAQVLDVRNRPLRYRPGDRRRRTMTEVTVGYANSGLGRSTLKVTFFNLRSGYTKTFEAGRWGLFAGVVGVYKGARQLTHPKHTWLSGSDDAGEKVADLTGLIPVYPATKDVESWNIMKATRGLLKLLPSRLPDPVPADVRERHHLVDLSTALSEIHFPPSRDAAAKARHRLAFDEAFGLQVVLAQRRRAAAADPATPRPARPGGLADAFDAALPFELTAGQRAVGKALEADLAAEHPMHRLLQGEVGSGKTVCALRAMLQVVDAGGQAALLAPTEVLAVQHSRSLRALLGPLGRAGELDSAEQATRVALLHGSLPAAARRSALAEAASGEAGIVVGTHALLSEGVEFADLGMVVVDEQHRFGVEQRDALRAKGARPPHVLVMTATPIPRTVAMTVFGDLETSALAELPAGRSPIATHVVPSAEKPRHYERMWQRLREEVESGHQAYVVCPRIGDGAADEDAQAGTPEDGAPAVRPALAVLDVAPRLVEEELAGLRVGILHGRLPTDEKDAVMRDFAAGALDVLVATTVIEVGVDVPNATAMVVLDADRFGVSQLHQLRGRVGRGSAPGLCLLVTETVEGTAARDRLAAVAATLDGFELARLDLEQRREGDVLGAAQHGRRSRLKLLSLLRHADLIAAARDEATALVAADPELSKHPGLAEAVRQLVDEERAEYLEKG
jgi:ATP-dependent DNA helicase RecG